MNMNKGININTLIKKTRYNDEIAVVNINDGIDIEVNRFLTLEEIASFVNGVVNAVIDISTYEYNPEYFDYAFGYYVITLYSKIKPSKDLKKMHSLICSTDIVDNIIDVVDSKQLEEIKTAIKNKVDYYINKGNSISSLGIREVLGNIVKASDSISRADIERIIGVANDIKSVVGDITGRNGSDEL